jgi:hypothetical protein
VTDDVLLRRARAAVEEKRRRGVYSPDLVARLAEPLDVRPDPAFAGGLSWPEAVRTVAVSVEPPARSPRPVVGPVVTALKRAVQRGLRWYLPPLAAQITRHNQAVLDVLGEHNREILALRREVDALRRKVAALETPSPPDER